MRRTPTMNRNNNVFFEIALMAISVVFVVAYVCVRCSAYSTFYNECTVVLEEAVEATSITEAKNNLYKVIKYAEDKDLDTGYKSWYQNLVTSYDELKKVPADASYFTEDQALIEMYQRLTTPSLPKANIDIPFGISVYGHRTMFTIWGMASVVLAIILGVKTQRWFERTIG